MKWWNDLSSNGKVIVLVVASVLALFLTDAIAGTSTMPRPRARTTTTACTHSIAYELGGGARAVSITYENAQGNTEQKDRLVNGQTIKVGRMACGEFVYISTQNMTEHADVTCAIKSDGVTIESASSNGAYVIATCSGSVPQ